MGRGGRGALPKPEIVVPFRAMFSQGLLAGNLSDDGIKEPGSNNWVISGRYTTTGKPLVSNDPHRPVGNPSLRYIFHLVAPATSGSPGWNVIGAQEAPFVGVALGHNERIAWGLTITGTDQTDTFIEEVNPVNANEVKIQRQLGAAQDRPRGNQDQGRGRARGRIQDQPAWSDFLRGRGESSRLRTEVDIQRAGNRIVSCGSSAGPGEGLQGVP